MKPPRVTRLLAQAERFRRLLETGEVRNQSDLANLEGLTRARVTQILNLLKLHSDILSFVRAVPSTAPRNWVTERKLRALTALPPDEQMRLASTLIPGLAPGTQRTKLVG